MQWIAHWSLCITKSAVPENTASQPLEGHWKFLGAALCVCEGDINININLLKV